MDQIISFIEILKYGIIILFILGLIASLLSPFIVLGEQSLVADGLSHVSFMALTVGLIFFDDPFYVALPIVVIASILIKWLINTQKIKSDAALGIVSSVSFAIGLILIKNTNSMIDLESLIAGSLWLRNSTDVWLTLGLLIVTAVFIFLNYRNLLSLTLDLEYAKFSGIKTNLLSYVFASVIALFVVIGIRSVGVLLISSFLIFPLITANVFAKDFKSTIIIGTILTTIVIFSGIIIGHFANTSTSSMIVIIYAIIYIAMFIIKKLKKEFQS